MPDSTNVTRLQEGLSSLLDLVQTALNQKEVPDTLRHRVLGGIVAAEHEHTAALLSLWRHSPRSAQILLRSLMEGWVLANYIMHSDDDLRAKQYVTKGLRNNRTYYRRLCAAVERSPGAAAGILQRAGLASLEECMKRFSDVDRQIRQRDERDGTFPGVEECAGSLGLGAELTYAMVYGPILSESVHIGPTEVLRIRVAAGSEDFNGNPKTLWAALAFSVDLMRLAARHFGNPSEDALAPYDTLLGETRTWVAE